MPAQQALFALAESGLNQLLRLDPSSAQRLRPLATKRLRIKLPELNLAVLLAFSERVDFLLPSADSPIDCGLTLSLDAIVALQDPSRLTQLIKADKLDIDGDIEVAQQFSKVLKDLDIDFAEILSRYTGDVLAHTLVNGAKRARQKAGELSAKLQQILVDAAVEEKPIAAPAVGVAHFSDQVSALRADAGRFEQRLLLLEKARG